MRQISTMTSKGQVTIPVEMRRRLGLSPSDKVEFVMDEDDGLTLRLARARSFLDLKSSIPELPGRDSGDFVDIIREAQEEAFDRWLGLE
jgi:AbrB family looped-hinge helix DNA binding protein